MKFPPIRSGRDAGDSFEEPAKKRRIFIADVPADLIHRRTRSLEPPFRLFDTQPLNVIDRRVPVALLNRRLKLRSGMPDRLAACSIGLATEKWPLSQLCAL